ncbi:hypothetical protein [Flavobacterium agrisoli]|uniref:Lipoprotein n=1 Tax=Flavobacterium agrisoli TaxID=2793066 RepID=A0A934PQ00_9FLAO|nr:hypothetical protein [Flavobacterium agrisoli]MBK0370789.1 hypothetical protein [Flavobacterium agrisoli]
MNKTKISFLLATVVMSFFFSCSSDESTPTVAEPSAIMAAMTIDAANNFDLQTGIEVSTNNSTTKKSTAETCATISVENTTTAYPKTFIVDFGTGCTVNQITRKGKLKITITAPVIDTGAKMTIERVDYSINNLKLEGSIEYTNTTTDAKVPQWTRKVTNGKFTNGNGNLFLNSGSYTVKQTAGVDTPYLLTDNVYEMTEGKHVVTDHNGNNVTLTVKIPLIKKYSCAFISQGQLQIESGLFNGTVNYGNNDCDSDYTFTLNNGFVFNLKM